MQSVDELPGSPRIGLKVCGLTRRADVQACLDLEVDWLGLNFFAESPRYVDPIDVVEWLPTKMGNSHLVGLFVNASTHAIATVVEALGLRLIQLHGEESAEQVAELTQIAQVIRVYRLRSVDAISVLQADLDLCSRAGSLPDFILVDAHRPEARGGTGHRVSVAILQELARIQADLPPLILAGGITPKTVEALVQILRPSMVDVASGVEIAPGLKDPTRISALLAKLRDHLQPS